MTMKKETSIHGIKISKVTPEELDALKRPLGTSLRPFPMWGTQVTEDKGEKVLSQVLSVIADDNNPMMIYSERPYSEVMALAWCDMPVPSMLPIMYDGMERRRPESKNRTQMVIGNPGAGKSFLGAHQGRMRSKKPVEVFDCGGKNMNELLFEMVLDFGAGDALPMAIDKKLKAGTLQSLSYAKLKSMPGVSLGANGIESIDWGYFKGAANKDEIDQAFAILTDVSKIEGLENAGGNALGMNSQYGALIRWFIEDREGVLDEYNKSREGTDNALQTVWQFFNGEIDVCTVENPLKNKDLTSGPSTFTFRREDMGLGCFITLTGNKTEDGLTTRSLNKSVYSRLSPQTLPEPEHADWQHRICQMMTGFPVSTAYAMIGEQADKDPAAFGAWMLSLRREKARLQGTTVPAHQETLLENWDRVVSASRKLADFYSEWAKMTDVEKLTQYPTLGDEVDEEYSKKEGIDFRKIIQHIDEALPLRPRMEKADAPVFMNFDNFLKPEAMPEEKEKENLLLHFGTRLVEFLERMVYEKTEAVGKPKLYSALRATMNKCGLRDLALQEGARSKQRSVEDDLNISSFSGDLSKQAKMAQKVLCDYLRQADPRIQADDDQIITVKKMHDILSYVEKKDPAKTKELFVVNRDDDTMTASPMIAAYVEDAAIYAVQKQAELNLPAGSSVPDDEVDVPFMLEDLIHHDDLLASFAMPTVSAKNAGAIWEENLNKVMKPEDLKKDGKSDAAPLDMAQGKLAQGMAVTTLRVRFNDAAGEEGPVSVHVVRNNANGKMLLVSEKAPSKLQAAFKEAGVIHVNRNDLNAQARIEAGLLEVTRGMPEKVRANLAVAFKFRNDIPEADLRTDMRTLSEWMVDKDVDVMLGKFVVKKDWKKAA